MKLPPEIVDLLRSVIEMRTMQKCEKKTDSALEQCVDKKLERVIARTKIKLSEDLKEIIEAYFEEAG